MHGNDGIKERDGVDLAGMHVGLEAAEALIKDLDHAPGSPDQGPPSGDELFSVADRKLVSQYGALAEGIACLLGSACEVVLHSLSDIGHSVVKIVNSHITGRAVGSPMTDLGMRVLEQATTGGCDVIGPYFSTVANKKLRSVTVLLRSEEGVPVGFLCMNMDISAPFIDMVSVLLPPMQKPAVSQEPIEHFPASIRELVRQVITETGVIFGDDRNKRLIEELDRKGIFRIKGTVEVAAEELAISRHTIYYHLRDLHRRNADQDEQ